MGLLEHEEECVDSGAVSLLHWFAHVGDRYVAEHLSPAHIDVKRLRTDPCYGLRLFFRHSAYERSGAPRGFRIAAVKAIASAWPDLSQVPRLYAQYYGGKRNERNNPAFDPRLASLDIPTLVALVETGNLHDAFNALRLRGVGPKIRTFFLRDLVTVTGSESRLSMVEDFLYCQPIDVWVRETTKVLDLPPPSNAESRPWGAMGLNDEDGVAAVALIAAARLAEVSPLRVNQGVWYFCAHAVGDVARLRTLVRQRDPAVLSHELELVDEK